MRGHRSDRFGENVLETTQARGGLFAASAVSPVFLPALGVFSQFPHKQGVPLNKTQQWERAVCRSSVYVWWVRHDKKEKYVYDQKIHPKKR